MEYNLYCDFNIEKHKEKFTNYLEVLILSDGKVVYAVPSHQIKAEEIASNVLKCSRQGVIRACPREYYFDYMNWLLTISGAIAVWNDFIQTGEGGINEKQLQTLKRLKLHGVYKGRIGGLNNGGREMDQNCYGYI